MGREAICSFCGGTGNRIGWAYWEIYIPEINDVMQHEHQGFLKALVAIARHDLGLPAIRREDMVAERKFCHALAVEFNGCDKCHGSGLVTVNE